MKFGVDEVTRKRLRKSLGMYERRASVPVLYSVIVNERADFFVKEAALKELRRRYYLAVVDAGKRMSVKRIHATERLVYQDNTDESLSLWTEQHAKRADVWVVLELNEEIRMMRAGEQFLAYAIHERMFVPRFWSIEELLAEATGRGVTAVLNLKEAMWFDGRVMVGYVVVS